MYSSIKCILFSLLFTTLLYFPSKIYAIDCVVGQPLNECSTSCGNGGTCSAPNAHTFCEWTPDGNVESRCLCDKISLFCKKEEEINDEPSPSSCQDNPVEPPDGYTWKRSCSQTCSENNDCPQNNDGSVEKSTSNWCFSGTCMMLVAGTSSKDTPTEESQQGGKKKLSKQQKPTTTQESEEDEETEEDINLKAGNLPEKVFSQERDTSALKLSVDTICSGKKPAIRLSYIKEPDKTYKILFDPSIGITTLPEDLSLPLILYDSAYEQSELQVKPNTVYAMYVSTDTDEQSQILSVTTPLEAECINTKTVAKKSDPLPPLSDPKPTGNGFCAQPINATNAIPYALQVSWEPVKGAIGYAIRIDQDANPWGGDTVKEGDTVDNKTLQGENATTFSRVAEYGQTYSWWVHSINADGVYSTDPPHLKFTCPEKPSEDEENDDGSVGAGQLIKLQ